MLHRRESNNSFTAHAPRPDLVALSQSRILFANSMSDFTRANIEEVVDTRRPVGTEDVQRKRKRNAENQHNSVLEDGYEDNQEERENGLIYDGQSIATFPLHYGGSTLASSSKVTPHATSSTYQSVPSGDLEPAKRPNKSMEDRHRQKRCRPDPPTNYRPIRPKLQLITCPITIEELSNRNSRINDSPTPSNYSGKSENRSPAPHRNYTPFSHHRDDSRETETSIQGGGNGARFSTDNINVDNKPRQLGSPFQFQPRLERASSIPQYRSPSPRYHFSQPQPTPFNQYELPELDPPNFTYQDYIHSVLSLRADTADPSQYILPRYLDLDDTRLCALQMEAVEDHIHLDGMTDDYEDLYYQQFAEEEF
ncbi:hypothetical protein EYC84_000494 [Monilinia fructicola]|uniref:Uncharacterized protein n=1 Tax=Monilinia fructicola TaxID=38448 RepID=A0A5M9JSV6_MONFR|nr:hypothetical protein EYC84_000494 [Monilinia fructicola]